MAFAKHFISINCKNEKKLNHLSSDELKIEQDKSMTCAFSPKRGFWSGSCIYDNKWLVYISLTFKFHNFPNLW